MIVIQAPSSDSRSPKVARILIVEDERIIALNLRESLEALGYEVPGIVASAEQAILMAGDLQPDLVLMDIQLKKQMDGIQAADQIWNSLQIPVIYVTGHSDQSTLDRAKSTVPFGYILKPIREKELYVAIETALKRYEREQLLATVLRGMGDGVIVTDTHYSVQYLNQAAQVLTGWEVEEARDQPFTTVFRLLDERTREPIHNPLIEVVEHGETIYLEDYFLLVNRHGDTIPILDSAAPWKDNRGKILGAILVFRDDHRRQLESERNLALDEAQRLSFQAEELHRLNQLKDDFLANVSHEMRTPLTDLKLAIRMLELVLDRQGLLDAQASPASASIVRYLKIVNEGCNREMELVNDLLEIRAIDANAYPVSLTAVNFQEWLPALVENFQLRTEAVQHRLNVNVLPDIPPILLDQTCLARILTELLNNACKYTPEGEQIIVSVRVIRTEGGQGGELPTPDCLQIRISNSGTEIPESEQARIFEPFYRIPGSDRRQQGGSGLGLALLKKLVQLLQGKITVTSSQGWTNFTITLPVSLP
ncbi:hybrid sensor histidine kinase/response regulator [Leptolyngbya sp. 'hensonii']|uniref:hybrid sensor histidine kinase/response regulator n=1 Tax=Leptolyngbya sp. 'hensonii' TaxID=1922337 RepID=UPI00094FC564|nr:ATP-binding protein [Leptolyngbya sp. 'hensonii']OLP17778.1 hybrid sensor histidine kinase/response regulator [Leptolyngbya sp. 'hensonii']